MGQAADSTSCPGTLTESNHLRSFPAILEAPFCSLHFRWSRLFAWLDNSDLHPQSIFNFSFPICAMLGSLQLPFIIIIWQRNTKKYPRESPSL